MPTNLAIDDRLLKEAQREHRKQQDILSLFGSIDYERGYDYKRERKTKRI